MKKEYNEKRDDLDEHSKQNGFESQRNLLVDKTEKLVFRKRSWRYEDNKKEHEGYPNFLNPFESKEDENASIEEENDENDAEDKNILEYPVELNPFPTSDEEDSYEEDDFGQENNENNLEVPNDTENPTLMNPSENVVEDNNEDKNPLKEENLENDFSILEENVGIIIDNNADDKNHDIVEASSSDNSKNMITTNSLLPLSNIMSNALPADIKVKNAMRPAPLPPCLNLLATENKSTSNRMLDKTISSEVEKVTERKILRKAPPPPRRFAPLPQSVCLREQLPSRVKVCDFNNSTISNAEFPQGYRNLRPAPPPPVVRIIVFFLFYCVKFSV